jgi:hypothetical protein
MLLFICRTGCLKNKVQAHVFKVWSRECFIEVYIDNRSKIVIVYLVNDALG